MAKYDIHFQPIAAQEAYGFKCFGFGFRAALKVTGLQALVNRWVKTFMTPIGSDIFSPESGTQFGNLIGANIGSVTADTRDLIIVSIEDANEQVRNQDIRGMFPDSERLQNAELVDLRATDDGIELWVKIVNISGEALTIRLATLGTR